MTLVAMTVLCPGGMDRSEADGVEYTTMKKKISTKVLILLFVILLIIVPLIVYGLALFPLFPAGKNNDWAGFWGSYIGALLGAAITLWGVNLTLQETQNQFREDKRIEHSPYIEVYLCNEDDDTEKVCEDFVLMISKEPRIEEKLLIKVRNIGLGPALDVILDEVSFRYGDTQEEIKLDKETMLHLERALDVNDEILIRIRMKLDYSHIKEVPEKNEEDGLLDGTCSFNIKYRDLFRNEDIIRFQGMCQIPFNYGMDINMKKRYYRSEINSVGKQSICVKHSNIFTINKL